MALVVPDSLQEYWSVLPCPPPADLPDPGIEPASITSPELAGEFFTTSATWEAQQIYTTTHKINNKLSTLKPIMEKNLKKKNTYMTTKSLCCTPKTNTIL